MGCSKENGIDKLLVRWPTGASFSEMKTLSLAFSGASQLGLHFIGSVYAVMQGHGP